MKSTFKKFQTISGREILVRPNFSKKVFTIKTEGTKYRTYKLSENDFNDNLFNTGNDWQYFLKTSQDYFVIK